VVDITRDSPEEPSRQLLGVIVLVCLHRAVIWFDDSQPIAYFRLCVVHLKPHSFRCCPSLSCDEDDFADC